MRTHSQLPIGPFLHPEPTAVGVVELDRPLVVTTPTSDPGGPDHPDSLLLVRLHGEPLTFIHVGQPAGGLEPAELAECVWSEAADAIRGHVRRCECAPAPRSGRDLAHGLIATTGACSAERPSRPALTATVIVPTGARSEQLARCLGSLLAMPPDDGEIIVVDNMPGQGDTERVVALARRTHQRLRYVAEPRPGSSVARNRGIAESHSDIVVFADDDVVVDGGWLDWLLTPFADPVVSATTGLVLPLELETPAQKRFEKYAGFGRGLARQRFDRDEHKPGDPVLYPYWGAVFGTGASFAFRREELMAAGGFDPALGGGSMALAGEDIDAMSAAILRGGSLVYEPRSVCWHEHRRSEQALRRQLFNYGVGSTALLTKALVHDRRFLAAAARSAGTVADPRRRKREHALSGTQLRELVRLELGGMLRGPWRYLRSVRRAHRLGRASQPVTTRSNGSRSSRTTEPSLM